MSSGTPSEVSDISFSDADSFTDIGINEEPVNAQQVPDISLSEADKQNARGPRTRSMSRYPDAGRSVQVRG